MIYHVWSPGDPLPKSCNLNSLQYWSGSKWRECSDMPIKLNENVIQRWPAEPQEQRPTAFGLLSEVEQKELKKAESEGKALEYWHMDKWKPAINVAFYANDVYRIKPEPTYDFKVTMNGEPVNPKDISKETWMSFRGE